MASWTLFVASFVLVGFVDAHRTQCPQFATEENGSCYWIIPRKFGLPFPPNGFQAAAHADCARELIGAGLVTINDWTEHNFIFDWITRFSREPRPVWIGLHRPRRAVAGRAGLQWMSGETGIIDLIEPLDFGEGAALFLTDPRRFAPRMEGEDVFDPQVPVSALCEYKLPLEQAPTMKAPSMPNEPHYPHGPHQPHRPYSPQQPQQPQQPPGPRGTPYPPMFPAGRAPVRPPTFPGMRGQRPVRPPMFPAQGPVRPPMFPGQRPARPPMFPGQRPAWPPVPTLSPRIQPTTPTFFRPRQRPMPGGPYGPIGRPISNPKTPLQLLSDFITFGNDGGPLQQRIMSKKAKSSALQKLEDNNTNEAYAIAMP